ncbi:hypothetical protein Taro_042073 [Colocasia esculenta]|uniref:CW-type domain-containing protein n=1 Tax=Colocasia esculenta TaxID=4460 RepID=A0A843WXL3_COLES|nr:hypothetical protein [Colocasia esculenta]
MLSVGNREDARSGVAFGSDCRGGGGMEENEVEEGEAWSGQEDGTIVDPNIALSYIDEKIQDILGHFQKDFEGGVSAENLGSKFGGYGSFLPTYPRSPDRVSNHNNNPVSTYDPSAEGAHHRPALPVSAPVTAKNNYVAVAPQVDDAKRNETCAGSPYFGESIPQYDMISKLSKSNAPKIPKVRIKVGPDSALPRCNAAIYSDMGLVCSPSSSLEDSPTASGSSLDTRDSDGQSPLSVLKIMTCFPIPGGSVLSPLSNRLLQLIENEKPYLRDCKLGTLSTDIDAHDITKTETLPASNGQILMGKKAKTTEKSTRSSKFENLNSNADTENGTDVQMPIAKMLAFDDRDTPIRSNSRDAGDKTERQLFEVEMKAGGVTKEGNKNLGKDKEFSWDLSAEEPWEGMPSLDTGMFDAVENNCFHLKGKRKSESYSNDKVLEKGKLSNHKGIPFDLHNKGRGGSEQTCGVLNPVTDISKGRKDAMPAEDIKLKDPRKSALHEREGERMLQAGHHSSGTKRKTKRCNDVRYTDNLKENRTVAFSVSSKEKKRSFYSSRDHSESKQNAIRSLESSRILSVEFNSLGEAKDETAEYGSCLMSRDRAKDSTIGNEKNASSFVENVKDKLSDAEKPLMSEALRKGLYISPSNTNGSAPDAAPAPSSDPSDRENWVLCDRCQKWRLLPYWIHPDQLPHKWLCTMLNWLPGMNKCNFSEDETASALQALYQASVPENQSTTNGPSSEVAPETDSTVVQNVDHNHISSLGMTSSCEKKRNTLKDASCQVMRHCHSAKKNKHVSIKSRRLCQSQVESNASSEPSFQPVNKSAGLSAGKVDERQKKKHKREEQCSSEGDFFGQRNQPSKSKRKRGSEKDGLRTSKRLKMEEACNGDEDWHSDHDLTKSVPVLDDGTLSKMSQVTVRSVLGYNDDSSFKDSKCNSKDLSGSQSKPRAFIKVSLTGNRNGHYSTSYKENYEKKDSSTNKRKVKEQQEQVPPQTTVGSGVIMNDGANVKEEISGGSSRKEKKPRISKADEREPFKTPMDGKVKENNQGVKVLLSTRKACSLYGMEKEKESLENGQRGNQRDSVESEMNVDFLELKKDLSYVQTSITATSSSSKVSGSPKARSNFQEARGSPVESVSSSPSRIPNVNKFGSEKDTIRRDDPLDANLSVFRGSKKCWDGEIVGQIDQSATIRGDKSSSVTFEQNLGAYSIMKLELMDPAKGAPHYLHREAPLLAVGKAKDGSHFKTSRNFRDDSLAPVFEDINLGDDIQDKNCGHDPDKQKSCYNFSFGQQKSCKGSSLRTKEKHRSCISDVGKQEKHRSFKFNVGKNKVSDVDKCQVKACDSFSEKEDTCPIKNGDNFRNDADMDSLSLCIRHEDLGNGRFKDVVSDKEKKVSLGKCPSEYRRNDKLNFGVKDNLDSVFLAKRHRDPNSKINEVGTISTKKIMSLHDTPQKTMTREDKRLSGCLNPDQTQKLELTERSRSHSLPQPGDKLPEAQDPQTVLPNAKAGRSVSSVDVMIGDASKVQQQPKVDSQNGAHQSSSVHTITKKHDIPSPMKRDGNHLAASVVLKEATDLKHTANRLKKAGLEHESTDLYFQAALKFLHVASLLESSRAESDKHAESTQSMSMYSQTARLCGFCAHEYEKQKEMAAAAALAYKCMEVAYMKVVFSRYSSASKDCHELQTALHMVPSSNRSCCPGESPSSSASDIENANQSMADKAGPLKSINSPQMAGSHVIAAHHRPTFGRLLNFVSCIVHAIALLGQWRVEFDLVR